MTNYLHFIVLLARASSN